MTDAGGKILLVDGHSLAYRAFYGYPVESFSTSTGQYTNAVYGFITMLSSVVRSEQPTHIGVAFDHSRVTFRTAQYPDYKANRSATPDEFKPQIELIKELLDALAIPRVELDDYEADDIIATWVHQASNLSLPVLISTGDRDGFQLVNDDVTVLYPGRSEVQRMTPEAIEAKYGVRPERYPELAALVGETSDNLPGVPGVGPKTAAKWLREYDGLENLIRRAEQVPGQAGKSFQVHIADVERNRRLNALVKDLDLPVDAAHLVRVEPDWTAVSQLFDTLQFRALRDRVHEAFMVTKPIETQTLSVEVTVIRAGQASDWLKSHQLAPFGLEILGQFRAGEWELESLAIAESGGAVAWFDIHDLSPADGQALAAWLTDDSIAKSVHDFKEPLIGLWKHGWDLSGVICDTHLAAYLANPDRRVFDLPSLSERYLRRSLNTDQTTLDDQPAFDFGEHSSAESAAVNARAIADLAVPLSEELISKSADSLLRQIEIPLARVLARMEQTGIYMDKAFLADLGSRFDDQVRTAEQQAYDAIGHPANLSSPKQLQVVLFDELGMPKTRKTKSGYTTDAEALEWLNASTGHPFLEHLLAHRDAVKLRQTVDGLIRSIGSDSRIHTTFLQTAAATGRLSSQDPNLQNIPTRTPAGQQIRGCFVAGPGYGSLMTADYSQIEMRIMADVCGDDQLIEAFRSGWDFHTAMAANILGINPADVTSADRNRVKAVNYGLAYGLSAYGLSNQLKISVSDASRLMEDFFTRFGRVRDYLKSLVVEARSSGYTQTLLGRRRYLPDLGSSNRTRREMAERMALNAPIQGSAADIIKLAMLRINACLEKGFRSRMLLQVHDELVFEVAESEQVRLEAMVREQMAGAFDLAVPLDVSVGIGETWARAAH